jgi:nitrite reductase (NADH) large subunit
VAAWPATATVCTCRGITRATLDRALAGGAVTVAALAQATGASTVCGSCKPLLADLAGGTGAPLPMPRWLLGGSFVGAGLAAAAFAIALPYADTTMAPRQWDVLWTASSYKQLSGYSLLGLAVLVSTISLRKRLPRFSFASFASWQLAHVLVGAAAVLALAAHTGFRFGANLNAWLMTCFSALRPRSCNGAPSGRSARRSARRFGRTSFCCGRCRRCLGFTFYRATTFDGRGSAR